jgi:hypothetical protein
MPLVFLSHQIVSLQEIKKCSGVAMLSFVKYLRFIQEFFEVKYKPTYTMTCSCFKSIFPYNILYAFITSIFETYR